jgi:hypothetical protein
MVRLLSSVCSDEELRRGGLGIFMGSSSSLHQYPVSPGVTVRLLHWTFYEPVQRPADTRRYRRPALAPVSVACAPASPPDLRQRKRHLGLRICEGKHTRHAWQRAVQVARLHTR